jgi:hypothetical protein
MMAAGLVAWVLLGGGADPSELVRRLGSGPAAEREAAARQLEEIGAGALPLLRLARDVGQPEVRDRADALIDRIEGRLLTRPTPITLDFRDRPLPEVIAAINAQGAATLELFPEDPERWRRRTVTVQEPEPVPFWTALDRVCRAAQLQRKFPPGGRTQERPPVIRLVAGDDDVSSPLSDSGPFRTRLIVLSRQHDILLDQNPRLPISPLARVSQGRIDIEQFTLRMELTAEPRMSLATTGEPRLLEAIDDRGRSLVLPRDAPRDATKEFQARFNTAWARVALQDPGRRSRSIRRLRGVVPVAVVARKADPLDVPLAEAEGRTFRDGSLSATVRGLTIQPGRPMSLRLLLRDEGGRGEVLPERVRRNSDFFSSDFWQVRGQALVDVVDARGGEMPVFAQLDSMGQDEVQVTIRIPESSAGGPVPARLRCYRLVQAATEVTFEFADIPLP